MALKFVVAHDAHIFAKGVMVARVDNLMSKSLTHSYHNSARSCSIQYSEPF